MIPLVVQYYLGLVVPVLTSGKTSKKRQSKKRFRKLLAYSFLAAEPAPMREKKSDLLFLYSQRIILCRDRVRDLRHIHV